MKINSYPPKKAINKAYLKERVTRSEIEKFKENLRALFASVSATTNESEEHRKNSLSDFLKNTFYNPDYYINTNKNNDLAIYNGNTSKAPVGVLFEVKKPNSAEMLTLEKPNNKALQQLVLYYFQERESGNTAIKHLIATDIYNWFIFDENVFDKHVYHNTNFKRLYNNF